MHDSEELPDDVPAADAAEQQRAVSEPGPDERIAMPHELPMEPGDWQEQLETVEIDRTIAFSPHPRVTL